MAGYRPGGGESVRAMAHRVCAFYDELQATQCHVPDIIVICHAGTMRLLAARARGLAPEAMAQDAAREPHAIAYGETVLLDCV